MLVIPHIRERRQVLGLTLEEVAARAALDPDYLACLESGLAILYIEEVAILAKVLACDMLDLAEIVDR